MTDRADKASDERRMSFFDHLEELRRRLKVVVIAFVVGFGFFLTFSFRYGFLGIEMWLPLPHFNPQEVIASQFLIFLTDQFIPPNIETVQLTPWEAIVVQFKVALFLAALAISPISTYEFWAFVSPALKPKEKRLIVRVSIPVVILFLTGVAVALLVVLPFTIPFLYEIGSGFVDRSFFQIQEFFDFILLFSLAFGAAFELPVVMYGLSAIGAVDSEFWRQNWRYAAVAIFIFGAFITPDGSGVTMMLVSLPMLGLYGGGYGAVRVRERRLARTKT